MKRSYVAEFFGTFILSLVVLVLVAEGSVFTPLIVAGTVMILVYTTGHISGTHINPAVTAALWYAKKISGLEALSYVAAQSTGALLAMGTAWVLMPDLPAQLKPVQALVVTSGAVFIAEALGAFVLLFGIAAVVAGDVSRQLSGLVVGGSLLIGIIVAGSASNAVLNPAVALALGSVNIVYIAAPIVGAALGVRLYLFLHTKSPTRRKK